jgi:hypothetical protein
MARTFKNLGIEEKEAFALFDVFRFVCLKER